MEVRFIERANRCEVVQLLPVRFGLVQMSNFTRLDPLLNVHINFLFVLVPFWSQEAGTGEPNHF